MGFWGWFMLRDSVARSMFEVLIFLDLQCYMMDGEPVYERFICDDEGMC